MSRTVKNIIVYTVLFLSGGLVYILCEIVYRGYSHPAMFILGGISLIAVGLLDEKRKPP